jgi:hypothetical protein
MKSFLILPVHNVEYDFFPECILLKYIFPLQFNTLIFEFMYLCMPLHSLDINIYAMLPVSYINIFLIYIPFSTIK